MLRAIILAVATVFILSVFRMIATAMKQQFSEMMDSGKPRAGTTPNPPPPPPQSRPGGAGGALKRDPVCGMFIPESEAVTKQVRGETVYFCSGACRDKYAAA
jgi:YHS domain-containing protein